MFALENDPLACHDDEDRFACIRDWPFSSHNPPWPDFLTVSAHASAHAPVSSSMRLPSADSAPMNRTTTSLADDAKTPATMEQTFFGRDPVIIIVREPERKSYQRKWHSADSGVYASKIAFGGRPTTTNTAKYATSPSIGAFRLHVSAETDCMPRMELSCDLLYGERAFPLGMNKRLQPRIGESDVAVFFDVCSNGFYPTAGSYENARVRFQLWLDGAVVSRCTAASEYHIRSPDKKKK